MIDCDVLVVGLGPAGGAAAGCVARAGLNVVALEAKARVGEPIQCGELVPLALQPELRDRQVIVQRLSGMVTHLPSGHMARLDAAGIMIDRSALDRILAAEAHELGATLMTGTRLLAWDAQASCARVSNGGEDRLIRARVLVAADGPRSTVARLLGLAPLSMVRARQYGVSLRDPQDTASFWLSPAFPGGYAWLFPRGGEANLGVGMASGQGVSLKAALDELHDELDRAGVVGPDILRRTGGMIPVGSLRSPLVRGNVLFAGDAAGLTHPVTGAGIAPAMASGELAGQAAAKWIRTGRDQVLADYGQELQERYGPVYEKALQRRNLLESAWRQGRLDDAACRRGWFMFPEYHE